MVDKKLFVSVSLLFFSVFFLSGVSADISFSLSPVSSAEDVSTQYNLSVNNSNAGASANISQIGVSFDAWVFEFVSGTNESDSASVFSNESVGDLISLNWTNSSGYVVNGSSVNYFLFNVTGLLSGFQGMTVVAVNGSGGVSKELFIEVESACAGLDNATCSVTANCAWDDKMFDRCGPSCGDYSDKGDCEDVGGGYCMWDDMAPEGASCMYMPFSMQTFGCNIEDAGTCDAHANCTWEGMADMCIVDCFQYDSFGGGNETICNAAYGGDICKWEVDWIDETKGMCDPFFFDKGFEGFSPCFDFDGNKSGCAGLPDECVWFSEPNCIEGDWCYGDGSDPGFCDPLGGFDFGVDYSCWQYDGNKDACNDAIEQSQWPCSWNADPWASLINGTEAGWCNMIFGGGDSGGGSCWDYGNEFDCGSASGLGLPCEWKNSTGAECQEKGCWDYWDSASCLANQVDGCVWENNFNYCYEKSCWDLSSEAVCSNASAAYGLDCGWLNNSWGDGGKCEEFGCWARDWTNDTYCEAKAGCYWDGSHCYEKGCWDFPVEGDCTNNTLTGLKCNWNSDVTGWCEQQGCWSYDFTNETACENVTADLGLSCTWDGSNYCYEEIKACSDYDNKFECFGTGWCSWNDTACNAPEFQSKDFWNPGCWVFDQAGEDKCSNVTSCTWGGGICGDAGADANNGVQCADINNSEMCNNIPMLSSCCQWNGTGCQDAPMISSCWDLQEVPEGAAFCEDYNAKYSQTTCEEIAGDPWYMPCEWDSSVEECRFAGDNLFGGDAGDFSFDDIGSKSNCEATGGTWKEEKWTDSSGAVYWDEWCEIKFGFDNQFCDDSCWACEQQDNGTVWGDANASRGACEQSNAGCMFYEDINAYNGFGWCDMDWNKQGNCDDNCWECWDNGQCGDSAAGCKWFTDPWDSNYGWCDDKNVKTCDNDCFMCWDLANCQASSVGCSWSEESYFCQPSSSGENGESYEICFDGVDNDNDGFFDCADPSCMFDAFCGGSAVFGSDCMSIPDNETCLNESKHSGYNCTWVEDNWGNAWCDMPGAQCWTQDDNATACNLEDGCQYQTMDDFGKSGDEFCDINFSVMESSSCWDYGADADTCNAESGCAWQEDWYCVENPSDSWCVAQNESNGFMPGYCDHELWSCHQYDDNVTACGDADACGWIDDWWCSTPEGANDPWCDSNPGFCDPVCFSRNASVCGDNVTINGTSSDNVCQLLDSSEMGWCEPENMFKGCWGYDDNETACNENNESCVWIVDPFVNVAGGNGGFCGDLFMHQMTGDMDKSPPFYFTEESCVSGGNATKDICEIGIKDDPDNLAIVTRVYDVSNSAFCNNSFGFDSDFTGSESTKFYWYLDSDGNSSGGCAASDNANVVGMEFKFKHEVVMVDGEVVETKVAYKCMSGTWSPSQIKTNVWPEKVCYMVGGGVIAIDKADIMKLNGYVDESADMRIYAVTGSESDPYDTAGPVWYTPNTADFKFEDCAGFTDTDGDGFIPSEDPDCVDFFKKGYIDLEKGAQCDDGVDNDGNSLVDCEDMGCMYDSYYCSASDWEDDNTAPTITWMEVSTFMDGAFVEVDTDEPTDAVITFYKNDSYCANASNGIVIYDWKLNNSFELDDYDFWHDFPLENSSSYFVDASYEIESNETYYFKIRLCDQADNCALSACTGFTTATNVLEYRVGFDLPAPGANSTEPMGMMEVQFDWNRNGTFDDSIDGEEGFKINGTQGRDVDLRFHNPNASLPWAIDFLGVDFVKAQDLDIANAFVVNATPGGDPFVGMDSDSWKEMAQALGVDEIEIVIPQTLTNVSAASLMHCPDNVTDFTVAQGCVELSLADVDCTFGLTSTTCKIPSSVGFSVLGISEAAAPAQEEDDDSAGSSGGGGADTTTEDDSDVADVSDAGDADTGSEGGVVAEDVEADKASEGLVVDEGSSFWVWSFAFLLVALAGGVAFYFIKKK